MLQVLSLHSSLQMLAISLQAKDLGGRAFACTTLLLPCFTHPPTWLLSVVLSLLLYKQVTNQEESGRTALPPSHLPLPFHSRASWRPAVTYSSASHSLLLLPWPIEPYAYMASLILVHQTLPVLTLVTHSHWQTPSDTCFPADG